jgi:heme-degrading monooxygenase HmoA
MITVANRIYVNPDYAEQFEERFAQRAQLVDQMPGFQANLVLRPTEPDAPYVVLSFWDSQEDFEAWTRSDAFAKGHARSGSLPKEAFSGPSVLEVHEVFLDSRED